MKKVKVETEKVNKTLTYISTDITELSQLIHEREKLVCDNIDIPLMNQNRNTKPGLEMRLEGQIKKVRQARMLIKEKRTRIPGNDKTKKQKQKNC